MTEILASSNLLAGISRPSVRDHVFLTFDRTPYDVLLTFDPIPYDVLLTFDPIPYDVLLTFDPIPYDVLLFFFLNILVHLMSFFLCSVCDKIKV